MVRMLVGDLDVRRLARAGRVAHAEGLVARPYIANPCYPRWRPGCGRVGASGGLGRSDVSVVAVDGPVIAGWADLVAGLGRALEQLGRKAEFMRQGTGYYPGGQV